MSRLRSLLKVQLNGLIPINKMFHTTSKAEQAKYLFLFLLIIIGVIGLEVLFYIQSKFLGELFKSMGQLLLMPSIMYFGYAAFSLMISVLRGGPTLFSTKDWSLLGSLPLKKSQILGGNILTLYILELFTSLFFFIPVTIAFFQLHSSPLKHLPFILLHMIVSPVLPLAIGGIISVLLSFVTSRLPFRKFLTTVGGILFFIVIMFFSMSSSSSTNQMQQVQSLSKATGLVGKLFTFAHFYTKGFYGGIIKNIVIVFVISILAITAFLILYTASHENIVLRLDKAVTKRKYKLSSNSSSRFFALIKKDISMMFSSSGYIINTISGGVMAVIMAFVTLRQLPDLKFAFNYLPISKTLVFLLAVLALTVLGSVGNPAPTIISAEGVTFPVLKSLPIPSFTILFAKVTLSFLYIYPFIAFSTIYTGIHFKVDAVYYLIGLVSTMLLLYISCLIGVICNLFFPKFQWKSMNHLVKQNLAVFFSMIFDTIFVALLAVGGYFLFLNNPSLILIYILGSLTFFAVLFTFLLYRHGTKSLEKLTS